VISLCKFSAHHYVLLWERTLQFTTAVGLGDPVKIGCRLEEDGRAFSGITERNELVGCAGILIPWQGRGICWAMLDKGLPQGPMKDRIGVHRLVRRGLEQIIAEEGLTRVEANVQDDFPLAQAWVLSLGFQPESRMPKYRGEQTFTHYVRFS
jgi:hypothetical protein